MDITCSYCPCILLKWVKIQLAIWNETSLVQKWWFKKKLQKDSVMDYWCLASLAGIFSNIYILSKQMCLSSLWGRTETFQFKKPLMTEGHYYWWIKLSQTAQQWWSAGKHFQKNFSSWLDVFHYNLKVLESSLNLFQVLLMSMLAAKSGNQLRSVYDAYVFRCISF